MKQGWEIKKLGEVCDIICGQDYKSVQDDNGKYPIYGTGGIMGYASQYRCPAHTIIIGRKGSINNPIYVETEFWNVDTAFGVVPNKEYILPKFFYLFCRDYDFTRHDVSVTIPSLRRTDILKIDVPVPPIAEQEKIVAELDCLSGIIEKKKQQLKELDNLAQSIFYEMFGDPVENDKGWEKKRLDEIGKVITGNTPSTKDESNYSSADYCFVKPSDIAKDSISYISNTEFYVSEKAYINSRQLPKGSVLTTCIGIIGKVGILQKDATCNQQINAIIPNKDIDAKFLAHVLFMIRDVLTDVANAPIVPIINKKEFSSVSIPVPLFSLQQDFASKIESIEKQKELIAQSIKETETLFNSRMDYYFN